VQRKRLSALLVLAGVMLAGGVPAQPFVTSTTNQSQAETARVSDLLFMFTHRFLVSGGKVINSPTFALATGLTDRSEVEVRYATNSTVGGRFN